MTLIATVEYPAVAYNPVLGVIGHERLTASFYENANGKRKVKACRAFRETKFSIQFLNGWPIEKVLSEVRKL